MEYHLRESERERMEDMLCDAAMWGNLTLLHDVIARDFYILDRVLVGSFKGKNPLYVAISAGKTEFVLQLLKIKPDLAEVLDTEFGAALHLASAKGHIEIVKALVKVSPEMCLARDRDGNSPLHVAAMKGQVEVLKELVQTNSLIAQVKVDRGDTILHLCIKYNQFQCLEILLEMISDPDFVNVADSGGNTILHLAVSEKRLKMIKHVLSGSIIDVNAKNNSGRTALDMYFPAGGNPTGSEIQEILLNAGAKTRKQTIVEVGVEDLGKVESERRNTFMIVASLLATMTFLFGLTPPGGVFQDNSTGPGRAGKSILAYTDPYTFYNLVIGNTIAYLLSVSSILLLIFALPETNKTYNKTRKIITWFTISATVFAFVFSIVAISPDGSKARGGVLITNIVWGVVMLVFVEKSILCGKKRVEWRPWKGFSRSADVVGRDRSLPNAVGRNQYYV